MRVRIIIGVVTLTALLVIALLVMKLVGDDADTSLLRTTFTHETCANPCWMGIEIGATDDTALEAILNARGIRYDVGGIEGHTYTLNLATTDSPLWRSVNVPLASIYLGEDHVVQLMTIPLNICPSRMIEAFGEPEMMIQSEASADLGLVYPDVRLHFLWDSDSERIEGIVLHDSGWFEGTPENLLTWSDVADRFQSDCADAFS